MPHYLTVDCASRRNYQTFRENMDRCSLAGLVALMNFNGRFGRYFAGSLFLFPVLKPPPNPVRGAPPKPPPPPLRAYLPTSNIASKDWPPYPFGHSEEALLTDLGPEGFFRKQFLGFRIDSPFVGWRAKQSRFQNGTLPDKTHIGIEWTVSNLNRPWFNGSPTIANTAECDGNKWRAVIIEGIKEATKHKC